MFGLHLILTSLKTFIMEKDFIWKKDLLLLADVFEKFISTSLKYYNLDPWHYFSVPRLSWMLY